MEDENYYWNLSRYVHLNPCDGVKPLVESPESYLYSSYGGTREKVDDLTGLLTMNITDFSWGAMAAAILRMPNESMSMKD